MPLACRVKRNGLLVYHWLAELKEMDYWYIIGWQSYKKWMDRQTTIQ
jgi:hypothetical protein